MAVLHEAVQGFGGLLAGCNGIDGELRAGEAVSADEDVLLGALQGELVCDRAVSSAELDLAALEQGSVLNGLAYCEDNHIRIEGKQLLLIIGR